MFALIQSVVLTAVLLWSLWTVLGKITPVAKAQLQNRLALQLMRPEMPRVLNRLGLRMLPQVAAHCGTACSRCGACS